MPLFRRSEFDVHPESAAPVPAAAENPDLPTGFGGDPDGDFYVHPDLREHYRKDPKGERRAFAGRDALGWARQVVAMSLWDEVGAAEQMPRMSGMAGAPPVRMFPPDATPSQRLRYLSNNSLYAGRLPTEFPDELTDRYLHALRLEKAAAAAAAARRSRESAAQYAAQHRCQGCRMVRNDVPAQVAFVPGSAARSPLLPAGVRLCNSCVPGMVQRWAAALDAEVVGAHRRGDLLDDLITRQTAAAGAQRPAVQAS